MAARIVGEVDSVTLDCIRIRKIEERLIEEEFDSLKSFYHYLRCNKMSRQQWARESIMSLALQDAFEEVLDSRDNLSFQT